MVDHEILRNLLTKIFGQIRKSYKNDTQIAYDCPVCSHEIGEDYDGKGNLEFNLNKGFGKCWSCGDEKGTHGTIRKFIRKFGDNRDLKNYNKYNFDFNYIIEDDEGNVKIIKYKSNLKLPKDFISFKNIDLNNILHKKPYEYIKYRTSDEIIEKYNIGFCLNGEYAGRIIIPSYNKEKKLNYYTSRTYSGHKIKYKNPNEEEAGNKLNIIFNEIYLDYNKDIYLVEGPFDHIVTNNSTPLLGKDFSYELFHNLYEKAKSNIIIALDPDAYERSIQIFNELNVGKLKNKIFILKLKKHDLSKLYSLYGENNYNLILKKYYKPKESSIFDFIN